MRHFKFLVAVFAVFISLVGCYDQKKSSNSSKSEKEISSTDEKIIEFNVDGVKFSMVEVEGGTFTMGATEDQGNDDLDEEKPIHEVTLSSYCIGQTEVTQELWQAVMGDNPSKFKGAKRPVDCVSWDDCQEFIRKLNEKTGKNFRMPTEAEWEYAARGGNRSQHYKYSGSNDADDVAWCGQALEDKVEGTHDVATKRPNELGIYDMSGNVYEWCSDWYGDYNSSSQTNPQGPSNGSDRVSRSGCYLDLDENIPLSIRCGVMPDFCDDIFGLRLAL